jgi:glycosyltransferase involved in cell wall biosynthesis
MSSKTLRVLYSFPDDIGSPGIGTTAWYQVTGSAQQGIEVHVHPTVVVKPIPGAARVQETLRRFGVAIPQSLLGVERALALHDWIVAQRLEKLRGAVDLVHCWPDASLRTLQTARRLGIPSVLERPVAHTRFAYEVVGAEYKRLGMKLPKGHCCTYGESRLQLEEKEYGLADRLLCPSDFVVRTFIEKGTPASKLVRHQYGYDPAQFSASGEENCLSENHLSVVFVGRCEPWKGLHYALEAWHSSSARDHGTFTICGRFIPGYAERLGSLLNHKSVRVIGFTPDVPAQMRSAHALILPTVVEGSALVTYEARACGCVLLVSDASGAPCQHLKDSLVHQVGDIATLTRHIDMLHQDRQLLKRLRQASLASLDQITWTSAAQRLAEIYRALIVNKGNRRD